MTENSRVRIVKYKPRFTDMEAHDLLPEEIRRALWEGPVAYGAQRLLREYRAMAKARGHEEACSYWVRLIELWRKVEIINAAPWNPQRSRIRTSPHKAANASMQTSGLQ